jgi:hypothetical protein
MTDKLSRKQLGSRSNSALGKGDEVKKKDKREKREHRKSAPPSSTIVEGGKKKPSLPLIKIPSPEKRLFSVSPPLSANSGSASSPTSPGHVYRPHPNGRDLYNGLRDEFDDCDVPFCFQCGGSPLETGLLVVATEKTNFKYHEGREVDIYRPVFSCQACQQSVVAKRLTDPLYRVRLFPGAHEFYETQ